MSDAKENETAPAKDRTSVNRESDRELVVTRTFRGPAHMVFAAWTTPALLKRWWTPKSFGINFVSCDVDARTGGSYRFVFTHSASDQPMAFFGKYIDVVPDARLVWTNEESGDDGSVTTVTFEQRGDETLVVMRDLFPTKAALDAAIESGSTCGYGESFEQLDEVLAG